MRKNKEVSDKPIKIEKKQVIHILKENGCETLDELQNLINFLNSENKRLHAINVESLKKLNILGVRVKTLENQTKNYDEQYNQNKMIYKNKYKKKISEFQNQISAVINYTKDKENEYNRLIEDQVKYFRNFFLNFNKNVNLIISNDHSNSSSCTSEDSSRISSNANSNNDKDSLEEPEEEPPSDTKQNGDETKSSLKGSISDTPIENEYAKQKFEKQQEEETEETENIEEPIIIKKRNSHEESKNNTEFQMSKVRSDNFRYLNKNNIEKQSSSSKLSSSVRVVEKKKNMEESSVVVGKIQKKKNLERTAENHEDAYIQEVRSNGDVNHNEDVSTEYNKYTHDYNRKYEEENSPEDIATSYGYVHDYDKELEEENINRESNENREKRNHYENNNMFAYHKKDRELLNKSGYSNENKKHTYIGEEEEEVKEAAKKQEIEYSNPTKDNYDYVEHPSEDLKGLGKTIEGNALETQKTLNKIIDYNLDIKNRLSNLLEDVYTDPNKKKISLHTFSKNNNIQNDPESKQDHGNEENTNHISKHLSKTMNPKNNIMEIINNKLDMNCLEDLDTNKPKYVKFNTVHREIMNPRQHFVNSNKKTIDQIICL